MFEIGCVIFCLVITLIYNSTLKSKEAELKFYKNKCLELKGAVGARKVLVENKLAAEFMTKN